MRSRSLIRTRTALLMAVAMLFASLAPTVSQAMARLSGSPYTLVEACTSQGMRIFAVAADGSVMDEVPVLPSAHLEHCQFCSLNMAAAPPPADTPLIGRVMVLGVAPPLFLHAPRTLAVWLAAPARAPPTLL